MKNYKKENRKRIIALVAMVLIMIMALVGCGQKSKVDDANSGSAQAFTQEEGSSDSEETNENSADQQSNEKSEGEEGDAAENVASTSSGKTENISTASSNESSSSVEIVTTVANITTDGMIDATDIFTERDMRQSVDLSQAEVITVKDGEDVNITKEGIYLIEGSGTDSSIIVNVTDTEKVQLVLNGVTITNNNQPIIYVKSADKVFVTSAENSENNLTVSGTFVADGETNTDAVIFSKDDLVLNGLGVINIDSTENGITSKDDLKITGGTINIDSTSDALEANDSIAVADGTINIISQKDGFHAEKDTDDTVGYVYICGGTINVDAADDGIHGTTIVQIDAGDLSISGYEAIEATCIQINDGNVSLYSGDDGINASYKSGSYNPVVEINGGYISISMSQGDTDAVDSNGDLYINGGTLDITGQSPFDYDGYAEYNGGTIIVNGVETNEVTNQMMGGPGGGFGGMGGHGGGFGFGG